MEGQKRLLRRLSVRGVESDKPSVCMARILTQIINGRPTLGNKTDSTPMWNPSRTLLNENAILLS